MQENREFVKNKKNNNVLLGIIIILLLVILVGGVILYKEVLNKDNSNLENNNGLVDDEADSNQETDLPLSEIDVSDNANGSVIYLCSNNTVDVKIKGETIYKNEVCTDATYVGKYICQTEDCTMGGFASQIGGNYIDAEKGIAIVKDGATEGFLYNFKTEEKISKNYNFVVGIYYGNSTMAGGNTIINPEYMVVSNSSEKQGIIRYDGTLITEFIYDNIGFSMIQGASEKVIPVEKNGKWGFLDYKTGKETTKIQYDLVGGSTSMDTGVPIYNTTYHLAYVKTDKESFILDILNDQTKLTLSKKYDYVLPLGTDLLLIQDGQTIDIVDYNLKSVLQEKITFEGKLVNVTGSQDASITVGTYPESITSYKFTYQTKTLTKTSN